MRCQLTLQRLTASVRHHPGDYPLTEVGVWLTGDGGLAHARVIEQRDLDLTGTHLVATGLDQVGRAAPDDAPVAVGIARRQVAGVEPALA